MKRFLTALLVTAAVAGANVSASADDAAVKAIVDKAVKALGGEEKLSKIKSASWKSTGTMALFGNEGKVTTRWLLHGPNHFRQDFEATVGGNPIKGATILAGDKGWRKPGAEDAEELDDEGLQDEKRIFQLQFVAITILPLKTKGYKLEAAEEQQIDDKAAVGVKVTPPKGGEFTLYFDKENGLPVKLVANVVFLGSESSWETTYSGYKDMGGIKKATKVKVDRDGEKFLDQSISDFKILDKVDPKKFSMPE